MVKIIDSFIYEKAKFKDTLSGLDVLSFNNPC